MEADHDRLSVTTMTKKTRVSSWRWLLAAALIGAFLLRLYSIHFGLPALNDSDELMFELGAVKMLRGLTLDPGWFGHPATTTMYVLALVDITVFIAGYGAGWFSSVQHFGDVIYGDPTWVILPGRIAICLFAIGTIFLTYRLAERLFDWRAGMVAIALLAVSPAHITYSQIIRSDMMACFFMLLCMLSALNIAERGRTRDYVLAALWIGVAVATKWPFALSILAVFGAAAYRLWSGALEGRPQIVGQLALCCLLSPLFLILASPYLLLDYPTVVRNLTGEMRPYHLGATGGSPIENILWYLRNLFVHGVGPVGVLLAAGGAIALARSRLAAALLLPPAIGFVLLISTQHLVWERWGLPLLLFAALLAGRGAVWLYDGAGRFLRPTAARGLAGVVALLALALPLKVTTADAVERLHDTRQLAAQWAKAQIRPGQSVLIEHFAFDIVGEPWTILFPLGDAGCVDALAALRGKIDYSLVDGARQARSNIDYGTVAAERRSSCATDFAILTQYERYRAERDRFPEQYAAYADLLAKGTVVARFAPEAGRRGGPAVTIIAFKQPR